MGAIRDFPERSSGPDSSDFKLSPQEERKYHTFIDERSGFLDGVLTVGDKRFYPSEVLRLLDSTAYQRGYEDFKQAQMEDVLETASATFPTPVAYWAHMFNRVYDNQIQRMYFLRDTWESTIRLLHALVVAETRLRKYPLSTDRKDGFDHKSLLSDSMDRLLSNLEIILKQHGEAKRTLETASLLGKGTPNQLRTLNRLRNHFSHTQTPSEMQASSMTTDALAVIIPLFERMAEFSQMKLIRFKGFDPSNHRNLRCEPFAGSSTTPDRIDLELTKSEFDTVSSSQPPYLNPTNVLLHWNREMYCLSPFFCIRELPTRHGSQLCVFKRTRQLENQSRILEYEVLGEAESHQFPREDFEEHIGALKELFTISDGIGDG